ncbi:MAG: hypothetical protein COB23_01690 [Methylophaga sp.]|nr:MAG: hypothetical protein COB23_01690 [Methylophaga sp.]
MKVFSFRNIRIVFLLSLLAIAAIYTQDQRLNTTSWYQSIDVIIYPINGDGSAITEDYINNLSKKHFIDIDDFFTRGAKQYQLTVVTPIITQLGPIITSHPPAPPADRNAIFQVMLWSMKLRYWAYKNTPDSTSNTDRIRLFVLYRQGENNQALSHSLGLQKGLLGIIHAYSKPKQTRQNALVMAHEILHTVGASDKYNYRNNQPVFPDGYIRPNKQPRYPQRYCEIMAGRIPISATQATMPKDLRFCQVGEITAQQINWILTP